MNNPDDFFAEQDKRMGIPDEDVDEYIQGRFAAMQKNQSTAGRVVRTENIEIATYPPIKSQRERKRSLELDVSREDNNAENAVVGNKLNPVCVGFLPEPASPSTHAVGCAKRRKTTGDHSTSKQADCSFRVSSLDGPNPDPNSPGTTAQKSKASVVHPANSVGTELYRDVRPGASGWSSVSSSTELAPECNQDPKTPLLQVQPLRTADQAVHVSGDVSAFPIYANAPGSELKVDQTLVSTVDNLPAMEAFSLPSVSPRRNAAVFSSTTFDGHRKSSSGLTVNSPYLSPKGGTPEVALTAIPTAAALSSSRIADDSNEAGCTRETPVPQAPAGFNSAVDLDVSNITSPAHTPSGQSPYATWSSHTPSVIEAQLKRPEARKTMNSGRKSRKTPKSGSSSKQAKDKPKLITPLEYAQKLQSCLDLHVKTNYLKGKRIFYVGGDMMYASSTTRGRMEYIVKHGGTLVPRYDPAVVTHIVTDAGVRHTLQALSLKSLSDIPDSIPTVTWDWVVSGYRRASKQKPKLLSDRDDKGKKEAEDDRGDEDDPFDFEFMHAAFSERIDAGCHWKKVRGRGKPSGKVAHDSASRANSVHDDSGDISHISTFSQESRPTRSEERGIPLTVLPPPPLDFKSVESGKSVHATFEKREKVSEKDDPLSEYYAQARADREAQWSKDASDSDDGEYDFDYHRGPVPRRGFTCDLKGQKSTVCVNQHIVDKLEELRELHKAKSSEDDRWRAYSYGKCIPALRNYPKPIRSFGEARSIRGVGEKTALKIMEIINTGDLKRIKYEDTEEVAVTRIFQGIYGVGRHTAFAWFASGLRTLDDVKARKGGLKLSSAQEIGLKFYEDINSRMPREEARRIYEIIKPIALGIDSKLFIEIMGSYRRGKADCGDIDILITRPTSDGKTHQGVLRTLLEKLHSTGIITEDLAIPDHFSDLELVYRGLCKLPESSAKRRRIDFLCIPWASRGAALLYYTGDDIFNRAMRLKANKHGFSLNQRGLYSGVLRDPHDRQKKVCQGSIVASETEEEIFRILGVPWQEPHERVRG